MRIGMLWFDDNKTRDLADKINRANVHYQEKYGIEPDICYVHPSMIEEYMRQVIASGQTIDEKTDVLKGEAVIQGIAVKPSNTVLPHHLWIGRSK